MSRNQKRARGMSLVEVLVVIAIMGVILSVAVPRTQRWMDDQKAAAMARSISNAFHIAHQSARRTGRNHIVFFSPGGAGDTAGNPLVNAAGDSVPVLILDDGATGSAQQR